MSLDRLPDFIVIGAAKSATTWIAHNLQLHPDVFMPGPEPHYFSTEFHRGQTWYKQWFEQAGADQTIGEKSADYLAHPDAPHRIAKLLPTARLIVQLRNPIERAYSDYCMFFRRGSVGADPERYLDRSSTDIPRFLEDGLYSRHLKRFLDLFPREQVKIILYDHIRERPEAVFAEVCAHIGIEADRANLSLASPVKQKDASMLPLPLRRLLRPLKATVAPWRDRPWFKAAHSKIARPVRYPPLTNELRDRLRDYYAEDVQALERLLGFKVSSWLSARSGQG